MILMIFQPIEVLVPFAARPASVRFMFFHPEGAGVDFMRVWVDDGEGPIIVCG